MIFLRIWKKDLQRQEKQNNSRQKKHRPRCDCGLCFFIRQLTGYPDRLLFLNLFFHGMIFRKTGHFCLFLERNVSAWRRNMDFTHHYSSPLGGITMASDGEALTGLWFDGQKYYAAALSGDCTECSLPVFTEADRWLDLYFSGRIPDFTPALNPQTTEFRSAVWKILLTIPYGRTVSYGWIAEMLAQQTQKPRISARAVGGAVAHNAVSLIIPCHRVVGSDGSLTGYAAGTCRKKYLLEMEKAVSLRNPALR